MMLKGGFLYKESIISLLAAGWQIADRSLKD